MATITHHPAARTRKAAALVAVLRHPRTPGVTVDDVTTLDADTRRLVERLADVRPCSDTTWSLAAKMVAEEQRVYGVLDRAIGSLDAVGVQVQK